jgi:hypothetical protein
MTWRWKTDFKDIRFTFLATGVEYGHTSAAEDLNPRHVVETLANDWSFSRGQPLNKALTWLLARPAAGHLSPRHHPSRKQAAQKWDDAMRKFLRLVTQTSELLINRFNTEISAV